MKPSWTQTTPQEFKNVDQVIFMSRDNYQYCVEKQLLGDIPHVIWDLPDFDDSGLNLKPYRQEMELKFIDQSEKMFSDLKQKIDNWLVEFSA